MQLMGLSVSTLLALGAVTGALVVVAYILKLKRRPVPVVFAPLWRSVLRDKDATSLFSQLRRILSLLLQLILLALLLMALADPRTSSSLTKSRHLVILVDASASMKATDVVPNRIEVAKEKVREIARSMGGSDKALIAQMDASITPLSTMTDEQPVLEQSAARVTATDGRADFAQGLRFAIDALQGLENPEIVVVSDGNLGEARDVSGPVNLGDIKLSYIQIGSSDPAQDNNTAITQFAVRRYPLDKSRYEVLIEVANTTGKPLDLELSLFGDELLIDLTRFRVEPGQRVPRFYPNLSGARRLLRAQLQLAGGKSDNLPVDDIAYALLPQRKRARVLCVTQGNTYLEAALLLDEYLEVTLVDPPSYPVKNHAFDVTIFDNVTPDVAPNSGALLYLNPEGDRSPVQIQKGTLSSVGFDVWDKDSPLLRWTTIQNVNIATALKLKPDKSDKIVGSSAHGPLLVSGKRGGHPFLVLGFDIRNSDFPLRISWPLFLLNTINEFMHEDTSYISSYRTAALWRIPIDSDAEKAWLLTPLKNKQQVPVVQGHAVYLGQQAGVYKLTWGAEDSEQSIEFAANLSDLDESRITAANSLRVGNTTAGKLEDFGVGVRTEIWIYLLLLAVALTTLEWITYHRRITV